MNLEQLCKLVTTVLSDMKAINTCLLDVSNMTTITDMMCITSGSSERHVLATAKQLTQQLKQAGHKSFNIEGQENGEWVVLDLGDIIVHIMHPLTRSFYQLEKLWLVPALEEQVVDLVN